MDSSKARIEWNRRAGFYLVAFLTMVVFTWMFADLLWRVDFSVLKFVLVVIFSLLCYPLSTGFWQSLAGAFGRTVLPGGEVEGPLPGPRSVAVNIPVYNEEIETVLARLEVLYNSILKTGRIELFDFYILSDSNKAENWVAEEYGWARLCRKLDGFERIFYRRRKRNIHQKAGNLLNFCESWGRRYKYMVVLDADSLMSGETLVRMTRRMEGNPRLGILQSVPLLTRARTRYGIMQQFANRIYGQVFARGMNFWQGRKGNYWGHNAIIRVEAFIRHCALPDLPGRPPLGGKILSHDFVEAALMVRAGYEVRMDDQECGSFEEGPADVLDSATRDRRWCQGNMQHFWLLFADDLHWASKLHFINGLFAYLGSCFWMLFLVLSIALAFEWEKSGLSMIAVEGTSPLGNLSIFQHAVLLFLIVLVLLLTPKAVGLARAARDPVKRQRFGGLGSLLGLGILEILLSTLVAPVMMLFHFRFVTLTLLGKGIGWAPQSRNAAGLDWGPASKALRLHTLTGLAFMLVSILVGPGFLFWMSPIWVGLLLSVPIAVFLSRRDNSRLAAAFLRGSEDSPEEQELSRLIRENDLGLEFFTTTANGFQNAVVDPIFNAVHVSILEESAETQSGLVAPGDEFFRTDPDLIDSRECFAMLESADCMRQLHARVWRLPEDQLHPSWSRVLERYTLKPVFNP